MNLTFKQYCKYLNENPGVIPRVELDRIKGPVIKSFIEYIKLWQIEHSNKIGKAIQLGIEDATIN